MPQRLKATCRAKDGQEGSDRPDDSEALNSGVTGTRCSVASGDNVEDTTSVLGIEVVGVLYRGPVDSDRRGTLPKEGRARVLIGLIRQVPRRPPGAMATGCALAVSFGICGLSNWVYTTNIGETRPGLGFIRRTSRAKVLIAEQS